MPASLHCLAVAWWLARLLLTAKRCTQTCTAKCILPCCKQRYKRTIASKNVAPETRDFNQMRCCKSQRSGSANNQKYYGT